MSELTPYIAVADARAALEWYVEHLGAEVNYQPIVMPDGRIGHCELSIDGARWMMSDPHPEIHVDAPMRDRGAAVTLHLTVEDVDGLVARPSPGKRCWTEARRTTRSVAWRCSAIPSGIDGSCTGLLEPVRARRPHGHATSPETGGFRPGTRRVACSCGPSETTCSPSRPDDQRPPRVPVGLAIERERRSQRANCPHISQCLTVLAQSTMT